MKTKTASFSAARGAGEAFLGVEVSWDMGENAVDMHIPRDQFEELFCSAGATEDLFRPRQTPENNLPKASRIGWSYQLGIDSKTITVKQLSRPDRDTPLAFGVYYRISVEGERDRWELGARVRVSKATGQVEVHPPQGAMQFPSEDAKTWGQAMADYANRSEYTAYNGHVSDMLILFGNRLGWVSRRVSGGVYFLPGELGERFITVLDGLENLTADAKVRFEGNVTPQYADPRTLQTWKRRTSQSFDQEIASLTERLKDMTSRPNVRESSFDLRVAECGALIQRAEQYSAVLQDHLAPLKAALEKLKTQFGNAQVQLRQAKGRADVAFAGIAEQAKPQPPVVPKPVVPARRLRRSKEDLDRLFQV